ncbi:hypothetical protein C3L33_17781, partial [Rhododendron williamsianum]
MRKKIRVKIFDDPITFCFILRCWSLKDNAVSEPVTMAIGDGENDVEMLELASLGIALSNGSDKAKAEANVIGVSNDEDGVADAIYRYAF